jgi:hypothetical protein
MYLNETSVIKFSMQLHSLKDFFIILSFDPFLLCLCTTEQLAYRWWYTYHSLRNPDLDDCSVFIE